MKRGGWSYITADEDLGELMFGVSGMVSETFGTRDLGKVKTLEWWKTAPGWKGLRDGG